MKAANVFRFVSIRPPTLATPKDPRVITESNISDETVDQLKKKVVQGKKKLPDARIELGREMIESERYFVRTDIWAGLRSEWPAVRILLQEVVRKPDLVEFGSRSIEILTRLYGKAFTLEEFLAGESLAPLNEAIWFSYYANILNPTLRPEDRDEIVGWLSFLHLIELTRNEPGFLRAAEKATRLRATVPVQFFDLPEARETPVPPREESKPPKQVDLHESEVRRTKERIAQLRETHRFLTDLSNDKLLRLEGAEPPPAKPGATERTRAVRAPVRERAKAGFHEESTNLLSNAPWRILREDLKPSEQHFQTLREIGRDPYTTHIPDLIYSVEQNIAFLEAQLSELTSTEQIVSTGKTLVRIRRT